MMRDIQHCDTLRVIITTPPHKLTRHADSLNIPPKQLPESPQSCPNEGFVSRRPDIVNHQGIAESLCRSHLNLNAIQEGALTAARSVQVPRHRVVHDADDRHTDGRIQATGIHNSSVSPLPIKQQGSRREKPGLLVAATAGMMRRARFLASIKVCENNLDITAAVANLLSTEYARKLYMGNNRDRRAI